MTSVEDQRSNVTTIAYDSADRVATITGPDSSTQLISSYQEQGWTNSGTSGSPAPATLMAAAATTYTDPNGNVFQMRPDWFGLGQLGQATDPYGDVAANDITRQWPALSSRSTHSVELPSTMTTARAIPTKITYPDLTSDQYTYNSDYEPLTHTDANGHTTSYTYSGRQPHGRRGPPAQPVRQ